MFRILALFTILGALSFAMSCGITESEKPEVPIDDEDAITSLSKNSGIDFRNLEIYGFQPASLPYDSEIIKDDEQQIITRYFDVNHVVVRFKRSGKLFKIKGSIDNFIMVQDISDGKPGIGRLLWLRGNVNYTEIANAYIKHLSQNALSKSASPECEEPICPQGYDKAPYYMKQIGGGEQNPECDYLYCVPPQQ